MTDRPTPHVPPVRNERMVGLHRTVLAVPASSERFVRKGLGSSPDVVMLDLEDGVAPADKAAARHVLREFVAGAPLDGSRFWLRINPADSAEFLADAGLLRELASAWNPVLVVPMATLRAVQAVAAALPGAGIAAMVETPGGLEEVVQLTEHGSVVGLMFGELDFIASLAAVGALRFSDTSWAHSRLINAAAAAGLWSISGPFPDVADTAGLQRAAALDAARGFAGKLCIHPDQLEKVSAEFSPSAADQEWAAALLDELEKLDRAAGAIRFRGRMVDAPVVARARVIAAHTKGTL